MEKKYCEFCGLELEKGACTCADFLQSSKEKNQLIPKIVCDTCKKHINVGSDFCPYCGIPLNVGKKDTNLQKELRGEYAEDVIEKYFGKKKTIVDKLKILFTPINLRLTIILLSILAVLLIIKVIMPFVQTKDENNIATESEIIIEETTTIQPIIDIKDKWVMQDGYYFCFDKNGDPVVDDWVIETDEEGNENWYYFDIDGKLVVNSWIDGEYFVGSDGAMLVDAVTPDGARVDEDGRVIVEDRGVAVQEMQVYYEDPNSTETKSATTQKSSTAGEIKGVEKDKQYELYIYDLGQHRETVRKNDESCDIIYYRPIIKGSKEKEVSALNESLLGLFNVNFKNILTNMANGRVDLPKTIVVNSIEQRKVTTNQMMILCNGRIIPRKGLPEKIKFRIIYDRKSKQIRVENITE